MREQLEGQHANLEEKLRTAQAKAEAYGLNVIDYGEAREFAVSAADELVAAAQAKLTAKRDLIAAYESKEWQAKANYDRQVRLANQGIKPRKEIEKLKKDWEVAKAELAAAQQAVTTAEKGTCGEKARTRKRSDGWRRPRWTTLER